MSSRLRILFTTTEYPHGDVQCGGVGTYVAAIARKLVHRGHDVHVLSCAEGQLHSDHIDHGVHVHCRSQMQFGGWGRIEKKLKIPATIESLRVGLSNYIEASRLGVDFDVIEYPDLEADGWCYALFHNRPLVAHLHLPPMLWYPHGDSPLGGRDLRWISALTSMATKRADVVTCPSTLLVQRLHRIGWLKTTKPRVVPQFIDWRAWEHVSPVEKSPPNVVSIGWLGFNKAPEILVEALALVQKKLPAARANFLGGTLDHREGLPYEEWLKKNVPGSEFCSFCGHVPHDRITNYISTSRVFAMPSWFENYPVAALEAMASGRPVVVTSTSGIAGLIEKSGSGTVVPPGDPKAMANALLPYLRDADVAAKTGSIAQRAVRNYLDPDIIATQREAVYAEAIATFNESKKLF